MAMVIIIHVHLYAVSQKLKKKKNNLALRLAKLFKMMHELLRKTSALWPVDPGHFSPDYYVTPFYVLKNDGFDSVLTFLL